MNAVLTQQRILVGGGDHFELLGALVETEPSPAGSLHSGGFSVHLLLQVLKRPKVGVDLLSERTRAGYLGLLRAGRGEVLPEKLLVSCATRRLIPSLDLQSGY